MTRYFKSRMCQLVFVLAWGAVLLSCSRKQAEDRWNSQAHAVLSNFTGIHVTNEWRTIRAGGSQWHAPFDGGSDNTRYLLLLHGTPRSAEELLRVLESKDMPTVRQKPVPDGQALRFADWWHPELLGECTASSAVVTNAGRFYSLSLKLFQRETNCLLFASILEVTH
jgi:hypothetical protein